MGHRITDEAAHSACAGIMCMFSSTYNGEYEDVKAVHDGVGESQLLPPQCTAIRVSGFHHA